MPHIFMSHSKKDKEIRDWFANIFADSKVQAIRKEFEDFGNVIPWKSIASDILHPDTHAVFVLLGPNIASSQYTLNWVSFEVGVAAGAGKDVWVFERYEDPIQFPVPYVNHYMRYTLEDDIHFRNILNLVNGYLAWLPAGRHANVTKETRSTPCPSDTCRAEFYYHNLEDDLTCPTCKNTMTFEPNYQMRTTS